MDQKNALTITREGMDNLKHELEQLKTVKRKEVADKIKVALSFGDLSENSEYDEAKNEQAIVEARIAQLEHSIKNAKVVDKSDIKKDVIGIGSKVTVYDVKYNETIEYTIVGQTEADPLKGKISDRSPVGQALVGRKKGDKVEVEAPGGVAQYEIKEIG